MNTLAEMAHGGAWIRPKDATIPVYVTHPAHIQRLTLDGGMPVPDPRVAHPVHQEVAQPTVTPDQALVEENADLRARLERLEKLLAERAEPTEEEKEPRRGRAK